jgi:hypothetical protein
MNVQELIDALLEIEDKTLPIRLVDENVEDEDNVWAHTIEVNETGSSGYEVEGEVIIIGNY